MTSGEAISFFSQLNDLENNASSQTGDLSQLSRYLMIITDPGNQHVSLRPLGGIDQHPLIWGEIQDIFARVFSKKTEQSATL